MPQIEIRKVTTPQDYRAFFNFPWTHYKGDPNWVPPLLSVRQDVLDKKRGAAWDYLKGDYFCAWRDGTLVGTIGAVVNPRHNALHEERVGWFGAFETIDDQAVADALLNAAAEWARGEGMATLRGPQTFTTHEETGCLVENFSRPILQMPYNPPYYARLIEGAGLHKAMDLYSFYLDQSQAGAGGLHERLDRIAASIMKRNKITVRAADPRQRKQDFELIKDIYNTAWVKNWGFTPLTERELDDSIEAFGQIADPRLIYFAYVDGDPAGFILAVPDLNVAIQRAYPRPGEPELWSLLKVLWFWRVRRIIEGVRVPLMGVKEAYRGRGVDAVLYSNILRAITELGYYHSDSGWILETNEAMVSIAKNFGSQIYKKHRLYEKAL